VKKKPDEFGDKEAKQRLEALLRGAFSGPPKTYEESKVGKKREPGKPSSRPRSRQKNNDRSKPE
jgi:hypothetical protein